MPEWRKVEKFDESILLKLEILFSNQRIVPSDNKGPVCYPPKVEKKEVGEIYLDLIESRQWRKDFEVI